MKRINLISGPRNISTALMYSFAQRPDTVVLDEPFYAVYLRLSDADHPGKEGILDSLPHTEGDVFRIIDDYREKAPVVFVKNMAHHIEVLEDQKMKTFVNIFLIRDPLRIIASYSKVIERPVMRDLGIAFQYALFREMERSNGEQPVIIDSHLLLTHPERVLRKLCDRCDIPFYPEMLRWNPGPKPYDGSWAPYWYGAAHGSTGFTAPENSLPEIHESLQPLYREAKTYYDKLLPYALTPEL